MNRRTIERAKIKKRMNDYYKIQYFTHTQKEDVYIFASWSILWFVRKHATIHYNINNTLSSKSQNISFPLLLDEEYTLFFIPISRQRKRHNYRHRRCCHPVASFYFAHTVTKHIHQVKQHNITTYVCTKWASFVRSLRCNSRMN